MPKLFLILLLTSLTATAADNIPFYNDKIFTDTEAKKIDADLNTVYKIVLSQTKDPESLKISQRTWLKFITQDCEAVSFGFGGSDQNMMHFEKLNCIAHYKKIRTEHLKSIAD